jgi:hypothetical protein
LELENWVWLWRCGDVLKAVKIVMELSVDDEREK